MEDSDQPTQQTQPAEGEPVEIPVPTREQVLRDLEKVAKPVDRHRNGGKDQAGAGSRSVSDE